MATPIPRSENSPKNAENAMVTATRPKSCGVRARASAAVKTSWIPTLAYLEPNWIAAAPLMPTGLRAVTGRTVDPDGCQQMVHVVGRPQ